MKITIFVILCMSLIISCSKSTGDGNNSNLGEDFKSACTGENYSASGSSIDVHEGQCRIGTGSVISESQVQGSFKLGENSKVTKTNATNLEMGNDSVVDNSEVYYLTLGNNSDVTDSFKVQGNLGSNVSIGNIEQEISNLIVDDNSTINDSTFHGVSVMTTETNFYFVTGSRIVNSSFHSTCQDSDRVGNIYVTTADDNVIENKNCSFTCSQFSNGEPIDLVKSCTSR